METDPVCGMNVSEDSEHYTEYVGKKYYFCSESCLRKFLTSPSQYLPEVSAVRSKAGCGCGEKNITPSRPERESHSCCSGTPHDQQVYTCPMHPEIEQQGPGRCPKCGMTLELRTA